MGMAVSQRQSSNGEDVGPVGWSGRCRVRDVVPYEQRLAMDRAIIERGAGQETLQKIFEKFGLAQYKISVEAFRRYAKRIEAEGRDYFLATLLGGLFGGMDSSRSARLHDAAQNMMAGLMLKLVRARRGELGIDELAKLVRLNLDLRKAAAISLAGPSARKASAADEDRVKTAEGLAGQVRQLYGVEEARRSTSPEGGEEAAEDDGTVKGKGAKGAKGAR